MSRGLPTMARLLPLGSVLTVLALTAPLLGCSSKKAPVPEIPGAIRTPPAAPALSTKTGEGTLPSTLVAHLEPGSIGPYAATKLDGGLLVVASPEKGGRVFRVAPLDAKGTPKSPLRVAAKAPEGLASFSLRPLERGYLAVWTRTTARGHVVETAAFDDDGSLGAVTTIVESLEPALWADAAAVPGGAHVFFAAPRGEDARVSVVPVDLQGKTRSAALVVAETARAWQVTSLGAGSALAAVEPASPASREGTAVVWLVPGTIVEAKGGVSRIEVSARGHASPDLDAVSIGPRLVLAYTDRSGRDARVHLAAVSQDGILEKPRPVVVSAADQAMLSLVAPAGAHGPLLLVWEDAAVRGPSGRRVLLSTVSPDLARSLATSTLDLGTTDETVPLFVGDGDGFAGLFLARACLKDAPSCASAKITPTVARLGADLAPSLLSPFFPAATDGAVPDLAWGLACSTSGCFALAADDDGSVVSARLEAGSTLYRSPFTPRPGGGRPRLVSAESIADTASLADAAVAKTETGFLLTTLTNHPEGAPPPALPADVDARSELAKDKRYGKKAPRAAIVTVRALDREARPGAAGGEGEGGTTLTVRGLTAGGVAIAAGSTGKDACVAWVARDDGNPEVFLTRVGADGKKQKQTVLTHQKGEVGDVAITAAEDGWLVAWIDTRDGTAESYAARVDHDLRKKGQETRLTNAPGDATELSVFGREADALIAFSDTRGAEKSGRGDPFVLRVGLSDGKKLGEETRLAKGVGHARGIRIVSAGRELLVLWTSHAHPSEKSSASTPVSLVRLDGNGAPKGLAETLKLPDQPLLSSLLVTCPGSPCRVVGTKAVGESLVLFAGTWQPDGLDVTTEDLIWLRAGPAMDPAPQLLGDQVLLLDDGPARTGRVKRLGLSW